MTRRKRVQVGQLGFACTLFGRAEPVRVVQVRPLLVQAGDGRLFRCNGFWSSYTFKPVEGD